MAVSPRDAVAIRSLGEVAEELGVTKSTVEQLERRGIKKMKKALEEKYGLTAEDFNFAGRKTIWGALSDTL